MHLSYLTHDVYIQTLNERGAWGLNFKILLVKGVKRKEKLGIYGLQD